MSPHLRNRRIWILAGLFLLSTYGLSTLKYAHTVTIAHENGNLLRLHILANSDSAVDQQLKLVVRDALVPMLAELTERQPTAGQAEAAVRRHESALAALAERVLQAAGYDYPVRVETGSFSFPAKQFAAASLPAGEYQAVRVIIGAGTGRNWWCVLFPPLCQMSEQGMEARAQAAASDGPPVAIRLRLLSGWQESRFVAQAVQMWQDALERMARYHAAEARGRISEIAADTGRSAAR